MPFLPIILALLLPLVLVVAMPFTLVQRYRLGTSRRAARSWVARLNLFLLIFSTVLFLVASALTNFWVPKALPYALLGLAGGCLLGMLGLALTHWERSPSTLHYTPNRWLVLLLTLAVTARVIYSFWRAWQAWGQTSGAAAWIQQAGVAVSLGVGAVVIGYYLAYTAGVLRRIRAGR